MSTKEATLSQAPLSQAEQDRKRKMKSAWDAYDGDFPEPLKVARGGYNGNVINNKIGTVVDKGVSSLFGSVVKIEAGDETATADTAKQDLLKALWGDDDTKMTLLSKVAINGGVFGQTFLKLIPPTGSRETPRIVNLDPRNIRIVTDAEDCDLILAFIIEYALGGEMQKRQIISRVDPNSDTSQVGEDDLEDYWMINNYTKKDTEEEWKPTDSDEDWKYPFPPIFTKQNLPNPNESWGKPDFGANLVQLNKVLNFNDTNIGRIIEFHAHPKTVATGVSDTEARLGIDDVLFLPSPESKIFNLEMSGDLAAAQAFSASLETSINIEGRTPAITLGDEKTPTNVSGVALALYFQPLIERTMQRRRLYGSLIREVCRGALVIMGLLPAEEFSTYPIELHWGSILPNDDIAAGQYAVILQQLGVSRSTIFQLLGLDPVAEAEKKAAEDAEQADMYAKGQGMPPMPPQIQGQPEQATPSKGAPQPSATVQPGQQPQAKPQEVAV